MMVVRQRGTASDMTFKPTEIKNTACAYAYTPRSLRETCLGS